MLNWKGKTKFPIDNLVVFEDIVHKNLTDDFLYRLRRYSVQLGNLDKIIEEIKKEIDGSKF